MLTNRWLGQLFATDVCANFKVTWHKN